MCIWGVCALAWCCCLSNIDSWFSFLSEQNRKQDGEGWTEWMENVERNELALLSLILTIVFDGSSSG